MSQPRRAKHRSSQLRRKGGSGITPLAAEDRQPAKRGRVWYMWHVSRMPLMASTHVAFQWIYVTAWMHSRRRTRSAPRSRRDVYTQSSPGPMAGPCVARAMACTGAACSDRQKLQTRESLASAVCTRAERCRIQTAAGGALRQGPGGRGGDSASGNRAAVYKLLKIKQGNGSDPGYGPRQ